MTERREGPPAGSARRRLSAALLLGGVAALLLPAPAQAHPLGNFTTNQYAGLRVTTGGIDVDYVLDLAELPAYQAIREDIDADHDGTPSAAERAAYAARTCAAAAGATSILVGGAPVPLAGRPVAVTTPPGTGGLATLRLQCVLHADVSIDTETTVGYRGGFLPDRIGWREVTAVGDRYTLTRSTVPTDSVTARLTAYPAATTTSDVRAAELTVRPGGPAAAPIAGTGQAATAQRGADRLTRWFTDLVGHPRLTLGVGLLAFVLALVLGGAHAVAPGHGKTVMAAYLVGAHGRMSQALAVAGSVAATHTLGVLALGVLLATSLHLAPQHLYDWLRLVSGVLVALVGVHLLRRAVRGMRASAAQRVTRLDHPHVDDHGEGRLHTHDTHGHAHAHPHTHAPHPHTHADDPHTHAHPHAPALDTHAHSAHPHPHPHGEHSHGGGRPHTHHLPAAGEPLRLRTVLAMGFAGGLAPSPSAVVVLLGAAALGRAWYGVLLVLAYGIGLAATLTGVGFALARWGDRLRGLGSGRIERLLLHRMPAATAATILAVGLGMVTVAAVGLLG